MSAGQGCHISVQLNARECTIPSFDDFYGDLL